jgi:antitoxin VapB
MLETPKFAAAHAVTLEKIYTQRYILIWDNHSMPKTAKIFMNGRSQAVRLPKDCRFDCDEVFVYKQGDTVILSATAPGWDEFFATPSAFGDDYLPEREDPAPQERDVY